MRYFRFAVAAGLLVALSACGDMEKSLNQLLGGSSMKKAAHVPNHIGPVTGAIFTTDSEGEQVNANIYTNKEDVYLNGGPRKPGAAGLPDGDYYYLVSDPGCKDQLAGPSAEAPNNTSLKIITVVDGEFTELMQLAPYADTSNPGGEYKVHVTLVDNYDPEANNGCFGFLPNLSKTDNFKVRASLPPPPPGEKHFCISGKKYFDRDKDGELDSPEKPINGSLTGVAGIQIILSDDQGDIASTSTSALGAWSFCGVLPGQYHVREELPAFGFWEQTFPENGAGHDVTVVDEDISNLLFGNVCHLDSENGPVPEDPSECMAELEVQ